MRLTWNVSRRMCVHLVLLLLAATFSTQVAFANECTYKRLRVSAVCGRVDGLDTGPIVGVTVALFDPKSSTRLQAVKTDSLGRFQFRNVKSGEYRLDVDREVPYWVGWPIQVTSTDATRCRQLLVVKVDPILKMGSCLDRNVVEKQKFKP